MEVKEASNKIVQFVMPTAKDGHTTLKGAITK